MQFLFCFFLFLFHKNHIKRRTKKKKKDQSMATQLLRRVLGSRSRQILSATNPNPNLALPIARAFSSDITPITATLFPGDGIGPEIAESVKQVFSVCIFIIICFFDSILLLLFFWINNWICASSNYVSYLLLCHFKQMKSYDMIVTLK